MLLGDFLVIPIDRVCRDRRQPLAKRIGKFGLQAADIDPWFDAPERIKPIRVGLFENTGFAFQDRLGIERKPQRRRITVNPVAKESCRSDSNNSYGMVLNVKRRSHNGWVGSMGGLPCLIAENRDRSRSRLVVGGLNHAPGTGA